VRVLKTSGDGDDFAITKALNELATRPNPPQIVSMSLSGYTEDDKPPVGISGAIARLQAKGIVVVASAGNDATCRPAWPAALPDVVSVAAMGPYGPAPFTNHGPWVRACAPGLEVVSRYFKNAEKGRATPLPGDSDLDDFDGWATWSGTSFAAPYVAGVLAREIMIRNLHPEDAVARVIDEPSLLRLPGLGTVVNG
jgi:subtilisin family serine protease